MKSNDNLKQKNDTYLLNKLDFYKNDSFGLQNKNKNNLNIKEYNKNIINKTNVDPRLELTLNYLDINSTLPTFISNNISFNDLLLLSKKDLIELGFSLVERNRILHFSQEYKKYGKKYNIQEINIFFNEFQNLNMKSISLNINNNNNNNHYNNMQIFSPKEKNDINNIPSNKDKDKDNIDFNNKNYSNKNNNFDNPNTNSLYLDDSQFKINYSNKKNSKLNNYSNKNLFQKRISNNIQSNKNYNNFDDNNNDIKSLNNLIPSNKSKNKNMKQESINNYSNNFQEKNSSKLLRQNSKASKNSSISKNNKSRLFTLSKNILPSAPSSGSIVQKFQDISDQIDNYFKKYNNYQEEKKNKLKKYQIITSSNNSKKNYNPIFINNNNNTSKSYIKNNLNNINNVNENENDMDIKLNNELSAKLLELQKTKKELKEKLNTVCDKENKKKMIIQYLEEEEDDK